MSDTATMNGSTTASPWTGVNHGKLGMWLFLASEIMFFAGLIGSYIVLRLGMGPGAWPDPNEKLGVTVLAINTFILICSSVTIILALRAARDGDTGKVGKNLLFTVVLGLAFLVIKAFDYHHLWTMETPFTINSERFGSFYYVMTGVHGLHVLGGIIAILCAFFLARKHGCTEKVGDRIENVGLYWHFVDIVWIILFAILCLM